MDFPNFIHNINNCIKKYWKINNTMTSTKKLLNNV